jgi:hypothetical protein
MVVVDLDAYETEAPRRLVIEDFPVLILNGLHGGNLYHRAPRSRPSRNPGRERLAMSVQTNETKYSCPTAIGRVGYVSGTDRSFR